MSWLAVLDLSPVHFAPWERFSQTPDPAGQFLWFQPLEDYACSAEPTADASFTRSWRPQNKNFPFWKKVNFYA